MSLLLSMLLGAVLGGALGILAGRDLSRDAAAAMRASPGRAALGLLRRSVYLWAALLGSLAVGPLVWPGAAAGYLVGFGGVMARRGACR